MSLSSTITSFFLLLQTRSAILSRIEFLVVIINLLFLVMFLLDTYRHRSRNAFIKYLLLVLNAIADSTLFYTFGLMQNTSFKNELFPVWALVLVNLRYSANYLSSYGLPDQYNQRFRELSQVASLLGVAFLNKASGTRFMPPLWTLWALQQVRSFFFIYAYNWARRSFWHGRNSVLLTEYMAVKSNLGNAGHEGSLMARYKYLVRGEHKQRIDLQKPHYVFHLNVISETKLITLNKIWQRSTLDGEMKDVCLSFALYRLLRCRFDDLPLPRDGIPMAQDLASDVERCFRILELELAFLNDYFYTRYPIVFWRGLPFASILHSILTIAATLWLGVDIRTIYKPPKGELAHVVRGFNVDVIITWAFMFLIVVTEIWKTVTYLFSDWTKVLLLCKYVESPRWMRNAMISKFVLFVCRSKLVKRWHGEIDQYDFLQSFDYDPGKWNKLYALSLGLIPRRNDGEKPGNRIKLPNAVKHAVLRSLCYLELDDERCLPPDMPSLRRNGVRDQFWWACQLKTCSHIILVWHIATSLCEIELAQRYNASITDAEVLRSVLSSLNCCSSSHPYLIKVERLGGELERHYMVANSLSRYCAYLLVSEPEMLHDSNFVPERIFQGTVRDARKVLQGCDSLLSRYSRLMREGERGSMTGEPTIVNMGTELGKALIETIKGDVARWKVVAEVWADLFVHLAPTWNTTVHKRRLESGGEFVTLLWSLLWHAGIERSKLWPQEGE